MSDIHIPPALDRHLVSALRAAATTGDHATGAFEAVVEQVVFALGEQGAERAEIQRALGDVFSALAHPYAQTSFGQRCAALETRALSIVDAAAARAAKSSALRRPLDPDVGGRV
jgi:hypothetical protein